MSHRGDCYGGNNLTFVVHHSPMLIGEVISIRKFWSRDSHVEKNPRKEELMKDIEDFLNNRVDKDHKTCRKIFIFQSTRTVS